MALGDFNLHVDVPTKSDVATFMSILSSLNMSQHVVDPTHKRGHTLDLIITRFDDDIVKNCNVRKCLSSDHYVVYFDVCKEKPPAQKIKSVTRNYKTIDMPSFVNDLQLQLSQLEINDTTMTNFAYDSFEQVLQNVLDKLRCIRQRSSIKMSLHQFVTI